MTPALTRRDRLRPAPEVQCGPYKSGYKVVLFVLIGFYTFKALLPHPTEHSKHPLEAQ